MLEISEAELSAKLLKWIEAVPFRIEGDFIVIEDVATFIQALDAQFKEWEAKEKAHAAKKV